MSKIEKLEDIPPYDGPDFYPEDVVITPATGHSLDFYGLLLGLKRNGMDDVEFAGVIRKAISDEQKK